MIIQSQGAIVRRYLRDPTFSRFDTIPECDGHTHRQTDARRRHIPRLARRRAVKKLAKFVVDIDAQAACDSSDTW